MKFNRIVILLVMFYILVSFFVSTIGLQVLEQNKEIRKLEKKIENITIKLKNESNN